MRIEPSVGDGSPEPVPNALVDSTIGVRSLDIQLSGQQRALRESLMDIHPQLEVMYIGALHVVDQADNPDRFPLAAHGIRELIEKLPEYLDVPTEGSRTPLTELVRDLANEWNRTAKDIDLVNTPSAQLLKFCSKLRRFFELFDIDYPTRMGRFRRFIRSRDPLSRNIQFPFEDHLIKAWGASNDYFQKISHHRRDTNEIEFKSQLENLEGILLNLLRPRTFDGFAAIDKLIEEGETSA